MLVNLLWLYAHNNMPFCSGTYNTSHSASHNMQSSMPEWRHMHHYRALPVSYWTVDWTKMRRW